jgi:hypothetical protein
VLALDSYQLTPAVGSVKMKLSLSQELKASTRALEIVKIPVSFSRFVGTPPGPPPSFNHPNARFAL